MAAPGVLDNDSDVDGDGLTAVLVSDVSNGTLALNADGSFAYNPNPSFVGSDSFTYKASDGSVDSGVATVGITVNPSAPVSFEVRVADGADDAEERASGRVGLTSSDLELVFDKDNQTVGIRFTGVTIPQGATITAAYVQFQANETQSEATALTIQAEAIDDAPTFANSTNNITGRARTGAAVSWNPDPWTKGEAGLAQRTPGQVPVIQEVVDRTGWASGNSLVIIIDGTGKRVAESYNGDPAAAPLLHVEYVHGG